MVWYGMAWYGMVWHGGGGGDDDDDDKKQANFLLHFLYFPFLLFLFK